MLNRDRGDSLMTEKLGDSMMLGRDTGDRLVLVQKTGASLTLLIDTGDSLMLVQKT